MTRRLQIAFMERALEAEFWGSVLRQAGLKMKARQIMAGGFKGKKTIEAAAPPAQAPPAAPAAGPLAGMSMGGLLGGSPPAQPGGLLGAADGPNIGKVLQGTGRLVCEAL